MRPGESPPSLPAIGQSSVNQYEVWYHIKRRIPDNSEFNSEFFGFAADSDARRGQFAQLVQRVVRKFPVRRNGEMNSPEQRI
jgi:hypothetical protein